MAHDMTFSLWNLTYEHELVFSWHFNDQWQFRGFDSRIFFVIL
jgi:hypothetical protein